MSSAVIEGGHSVDLPLLYCAQRVKEAGVSVIFVIHKIHVAWIKEDYIRVPFYDLLKVYLIVVLIRRLIGNVERVHAHERPEVRIGAAKAVAARRT